MDTEKAGIEPLGHDVGPVSQSASSTADYGGTSRSISLVINSGSQPILQDEKESVNPGDAPVAIATDSAAVEPLSRKHEFVVGTSDSNGKLPTMESDSAISVMCADFPDGGRWAWLALIGATAIACSTFGMTNSFGVYETYYASHQLRDNTPSDIAWIGSFQLFCMFSGGTVSGRLFDTYGPKWLLRVGSVMYFLAFILLPECKVYWQYFLCQGVLFGVGIAMIFFPAMGCVNHYFLKRRAMAIGIMVGGSSLGGLIWPIVVSQIVINPKLGFSWSARLIALINLPILLMCNVILRSRLPPRNPGPIIDLKYFKDPAFAFVCGGFFFVLLGMFSPLWYIQTFAYQVGVEKARAFWLLAIINGSSLPGRVLPGFYADYIGSFNVLTPCALMTSILLFMWYPISTPAGIYIFTVLYGFFQGAMISLQAASMASICKDLREIGSMIGMSSGVFAIAGLTGTPIAGALLKVGDGSFAAVIGFSAGSILLGTCGILIARMFVSKWKLFEKV